MGLMITVSRTLTEHDHLPDIVTHQHLAHHVTLLQRMVHKDQLLTTETPPTDTSQLSVTASSAPTAPPVEHAPTVASVTPELEQSIPRETNKLPRTIILVEDDREYANTLAEQLRLFNYDTHLITDLEGLPTLVRAINPAAIIMDIVFPSGDLAGVEAIAALQRERTAPVPVIYNLYFTTRRF